MKDEYIRIAEEQIIRSSATISRYIEKVDSEGIDIISQDILSQLRTLLDHSILRVYLDLVGSVKKEGIYQNIVEGKQYIKRYPDFKFLWRFHDHLQIIVSHYTLEPHDSERVMHKYYEYLVRIKSFLIREYNISILENLHDFKLLNDSSMKEYYEKIAGLVDATSITDLGEMSNDRYYIYKIKPFFVNAKIYYEITFGPATENSSKFDRMTAFTSLEMSDYYSVCFKLKTHYLDILENKIPIYIISEWEVNIRPVEIRNFSKLFGLDIRQHNRTREYRGLMVHLTQSKLSLLDLILSDLYDKTIESIVISFNINNKNFIKVLDHCREIVIANLPGHNILRYLLHNMNNSIVKSQIYQEENLKLSNLFLKYGAIPFDEMPFCTSLIQHNPKLSKLFDCIDTRDREHELLCRKIKNNCENNGNLFTDAKELVVFEDPDKLIKKFNDSLYSSSNHQKRRIRKMSNKYYIQSYVEESISILNALKLYARIGLRSYENFATGWINANKDKIDDEGKINIIKTAFSNALVAIIYGAAGTGKSTLINQVSNLFSSQKKLYIAHTNPAVENLRRRVDVQGENAVFMTLTAFVKSQKVETEFDIVFIDECSTISNKDMLDLLKKVDSKLLFLTGDLYQIESIRFGNWFSLLKNFMPSHTVHELKKPFRTEDKNLIKFWDKVRRMDDSIPETIAKNQYARNLDGSVLTVGEQDEIVLCLNYDGLYGINNLNRILQQANTNESYNWGLSTYKVNDPILFNETNRFTPLIHNNVKGWIRLIEMKNENIEFVVEVEKLINDLDAYYYDFELLESYETGNSLIKFVVNKYEEVDDNLERTSNSIVPFQVSYAISIHKAQGLEFDSVKIIITNEVEERISHNVFYTAITRAKRKILIYCSPDVQEKMLNRINHIDLRKDVHLLRNYMTQNIIDE